MAEMLDFLVKINALYSGAPQIQQASSALSQLQQKTQQLQQTSANISGFQKQAAKLTDLRTKLDAARMKVKNMQAEMRKGGNVDPKLFTRANQEAARLQEQVAQNTKRLGEFRAELRNAGVDTSDLAGAQSRLQAQTDAMTRAQERLNSAQSRMANLKATLSWQGLKENVIQPLLPVVSAVKAPVKLAADFEAAMARVKSVAFSDPDADLSGFNTLREQALQLGAETKFTSIQAAKAQENLLRANMSPQDVLDALPAVLNMASAEGMDIDNAAAIIAKGLGGMGLEAKLAPRLADILAYTSAKSNTDISEIGEGFKIAAPVLSAQGATMEQIAAYMGAMANKGYVGTDAGNALAASVMRLAKLPKEGADMLRSLGVATKTREGRMVDLPTIAAAMDKAMKSRGYGEVEQLNVIETVFGKGYGKAMQGFLAASASGDVQKLQAGEYIESFGRAKTMADINLDTLNGQLDILQSSWDGLRTTIGDIFSPVIRGGVELLSNALAGLNNLMKEFPALAQGATWALTAFASYKAVSGILNIGSAILQLPGAFADVIRAGGAARDALSAAGGAGKALSGIPAFIGSIKTAFVTLGSVIMAHPLLAIAGLVAVAVTAIIMNWDKVKAWWSNWVIPNVWEPVKEKAAAVWKWIKENWDLLLASLFGPVGHVVRLIIKNWDEIKAWWNEWVIPNVWEPVKKWCEGVYNWVSEKWQVFDKWWNSWTLADIWQSVIDGVEGAIAYVKGKWEDFKKWLSDMNPFANWKAPQLTPQATESGKTEVKQKHGSLNLTPSYMRGYAQGGIVSRPEIALIGEAGREAVIPLTDKTRGISLLGQAAQSLGVNIQAHAEGGIFSTPHVGLVAEAGREAVIPLTDKSRGIPLLTQAAQFLGLQVNHDDVSSSYPSMKEIANNVRNNSFSGGSNYSSVNNAVTQWPQVNLTVNVQSSQDENDDALASRIADKVREVLSDIMSIEERVAFA